jgi:hypothetical protein
MYGSSYMFRHYIGWACCVQWRGAWIDPRWCHWIFIPWHPTIPCARSRLTLLKWDQDTPGGKDDRCVRLTNYHLQVLMSRNLEALTFPESSGPHRPVMGMLYFFPYTWVTRVPAVNSITGFNGQWHNEMHKRWINGDITQDNKIKSHTNLWPENITWSSTPHNALTLKQIEQHRV